MLIHSGELLIEFESESNGIYMIQIQMIPVRDPKHSEDSESENISYSIQSVQITNNGTKYAEITDYVLSKYSKNNIQRKENVPFVTIKRIIIEILLILRKLPL